MTLVFAIIAIVCICFGICQLCGGYSIWRGIGIAGMRWGHRCDTYGLRP